MKGKPEGKPEFCLLVVYVGGIDDEADKAITKLVGKQPHSTEVELHGLRGRTLTFHVGEQLIKASKIRQGIHGKLCGGKYCTVSINKL